MRAPQNIALAWSTGAEPPRLGNEFHRLQGWGSGMFSGALEENLSNRRFGSLLLRESLRHHVHIWPGQGFQRFLSQARRPIAKTINITLSFFKNTWLIASSLTANPRAAAKCPTEFAQPQPRFVPHAETMALSVLRAAALQAFWARAKSLNQPCCPPSRSQPSPDQPLMTVTLKADRWPSPRQTAR